MIDVDQLRKLIKTVTLRLGPYSPAAVNLLLGTAAQESRLGTYIEQIGGGPALGIFQMEPATERDIWDNYLSFRPVLRAAVGAITGITRPDSLHLGGNIVYQIAMARVHYRRVPEALPDYRDTRGLAGYWKKYYNTLDGRGRVEEFIENFNRLIIQEVGE